MRSAAGWAKKSRDPKRLRTSLGTLPTRDRNDRARPLCQWYRCNERAFALHEKKRDRSPAKLIARTRPGGRAEVERESRLCQHSRRDERAFSRVREWIAGRMIYVKPLQEC